jgi:hypothetical protein
MPTPMPGAFQSFRIFSMQASKPANFWAISGFLGVDAVGQGHGEQSDCGDSAHDASSLD